MSTDTLRYAGFGPRLGSRLLDILMLLPLMGVFHWGDSQFRLFNLYYLVPGLLLGLFYSVYLVGRFGGTPGKLIVGIRIRKLDGSPAGYREAFLRELPWFAMNIMTSIGLILAAFHMTDAEYHSLAFMDRARRLAELSPAWTAPLTWLQTAWSWSELIVLLTNSKRRALHDFVAGTVVVHLDPISPTIASASDPAVAS